MKLSAYTGLEDGGGKSFTNYIDNKADTFPDEGCPGLVGEAHDDGGSRQLGQDVKNKLSFFIQHVLITLMSKGF